MEGFNQLTKVKSLREEAALRTLLAQRRKLEIAVAERDQARQRLDEFRHMKREEEERMYRELCERVVHVRDFRFVDGTMELLRSKDKQHDQDAKAARTRWESEQRQLETDRGAHAFAQRVHEKFADLADFLKREKEAVQTQREELELEDVSASGSRMRGQEQPR